MNNKHDPSRLVRKSYNYAPEDAGRIAQECVMLGYSIGWSGSLELLSEIQRLLAPFNISYVDDMWGEWAPTKR